MKRASTSGMEPCPTNAGLFAWGKKSFNSSARLPQRPAAAIALAFLHEPVAVVHCPAAQLILLLAATREGTGWKMVGANFLGGGKYGPAQEVCADYNFIPNRAGAPIFNAGTGPSGRQKGEPK